MRFEELEDTHRAVRSEQRKATEFGSTRLGEASSSITSANDSA
jgi:hypothetical protein